MGLDAEVVSAVFRGPGWRVTLADGTELEADFVIAATGVLHHPFTPEIPGLETFTGDVVHTARWDDFRLEHRPTNCGHRHGFDWGAGRSALQPEASKIAQFARTPQWVLWAPMGLRQPSVVTAALLLMAPSVNRRLYAAALQMSRDPGRHRDPAKLASASGAGLGAVELAGTGS